MIARICNSASVFRSSEHHTHRLQRSAERIQHQAKRFESDGAEQRLVFGFAQHDRRRGATTLEVEGAFADTSRERRPVRRSEERRVGKECRL